MPRRSNASPEEVPVTRRTSARIAAAQAASPVKSAAKSPRRKLQSAETAKTASEDNESQQSQVKSESSMEELNGIDSSFGKDTETTPCQAEIPVKKSKVDEEPNSNSNVLDELNSDIEKNETEASQNVDISVNQTQEISATSTDFEIVERSSVPPPDSAEVQAAISVQGEDGQLLVGFVQVDREELPAANSLEIKQATMTLECESEKLTCSFESAAKTDTTSETTLNNLNGNVGSKESLEDESSKPNGSVENSTHYKTAVSTEESCAQSPAAPAAGDIVPEVVLEIISQQ
ncbi:unnamed protein product [Heterobilharzia americana]|nr:unnamed protein product [Heterobilharzia americana]